MTDTLDIYNAIEVIDRLGDGWHYHVWQPPTPEDEMEFLDWSVRKYPFVQLACVPPSFMELRKYRMAIMKDNDLLEVKLRFGDDG